MKANRASSTAKVIAAATILLDAERRGPAMVAPGAAGLCRDFLSTRTADQLLAASAAWLPGRIVWRAVERFTHPGIIRHYWNRKRWIERRSREALAGGLENIVILGAGFDTLGIRLAREFEAVEVMEIDHAATQGAKRDAMARRRLELPPTLRFAAADLGAGGLPAKYFESGSTLVVMEGLLMYLREKSIHALFETLRKAPCRRLQVIFSFMEKWPDGSCGFRPRSRWIDRWLARRGEPFTWSIETDRLPGFLAARGFELTRLATTRELAGPPGGTLEGENLALCQRCHLSAGL